MLLGHFAVGFAVKKFAPKASLGTTLLAAQFVDLLWPLLVLAGLEHVRIDPGNTSMTPLDFYDYPISHSLIASVGWALGIGGVYYAVRNHLRGALILAGAVLSHWVLDFISHKPDMPLGFGGLYFGLGLWYSVTATAIVELSLFVAGIWLYLRSTQSRDGIGRYALWVGIGLMFTIYITNIFGPPPPNVTAIAIAGNLSWLFIMWGYWVDKHRKTESGTKVDRKLVDRMSPAGRGGEP